MLIYHHHNIEIVGVGGVDPRLNGLKKTYKSAAGSAMASSRAITTTPSSSTTTRRNNNISRKNEQFLRGLGFRVKQNNG